MSYDRPFLAKFISIPFLLVLALLVAASAWIVSLATASSPEPVPGAGTLTVGDHVYYFRPTSCVISDEDFAAAGTGIDDGQRFWVSASSIGLDLAVGTSSEIEQPADDQLWLVSDDRVDWEIHDDTVSATASMADRRVADATPVLGALELHCVPTDY